MSISGEAASFFDMFNKILSFFFWLFLHFFVALYNRLMYNSDIVEKGKYPFYPILLFAAVLTN